MKSTYRAATLAFGALLASSAVQAQSSVTLYGLADASLVWQNHASNDGGSKVFMTNGAINHSRFGLIGKEDLGGQASAFFQLESGFNQNDGSMSQSGVIFNRYALVGLKGNFGTLSAGNIASPFHNTMILYDPLTIGDYYNTSWWYGTDSGGKNSISYAYDFGPVHALLDYGVGGVAGSIARGSQFGASLSFTQNNLSLLAVYQQTKALTAGGTQRLIGLAGSYAWDKVTFYAGYQNNHDGAGITNSQLNIIGAPMGTDNVVRKDQGVFAGLTWQVTPTVLLREAYYYDVMHDAMNQSGNSGTHWTAVSEAEYFFSKRTSVYGQIDYNHTSGAGYVQLPNSNNQMELAVGLRHWF
ncbi:porin [Burkholderia cenocepacia]|uniref:porin n=1 Tax=Burkholderia cenocepacia TaxID=95486 RepID=UPI0028660079|nr:porin [Burkholderia cenocepacia]MDR8071910.1 porin [Burkholderia cenocepacia]